jgi:hypothetical protein
VTSHLIPSHRARPGNDPIFALSKLAAERKASGLATINATLGVLLDDEGKLATLPTATRALREATPEQLSSYAPIAGTAAFLEAIRRDVSRGDAGLLARAVAVATAGGTGALRHAITTLLEPGEALLTTSYYWGPYATIAAEHGRDVTSSGSATTWSVAPAASQSAFVRRSDGASDDQARSSGRASFLTCSTARAAASARSRTGFTSAAIFSLDFAFSRRERSMRWRTLAPSRIIPAVA